MSKSDGVTKLLLSTIAALLAIITWMTQEFTHDVASILSNHGTRIAVLEKEYVAMEAQIERDTQKPAYPRGGQKKQALPGYVEKDRF